MRVCSLQMDSSCDCVGRGRLPCASHFLQVTAIVAFVVLGWRSRRGKGGGACRHGAKTGRSTIIIILMRAPGAHYRSELFICKQQGKRWTLVTLCAFGDTPALRVPMVLDFEKLKPLSKDNSDGFIP